MTRYVLDTNVLLRFLLHDHPEHAEQADRLFEAAEQGRCTLVLSDVILAEAVWVLTSFYKQERAAVADTLARLLSKPGIRCDRAALLVDALDRFGSSRLDFIDCYLAAQAIGAEQTLVSFDAGLTKVEGLSVLDPASAAGKS